MNGQELVKSLNEFIREKYSFSDFGRGYSYTMKDEIEEKFGGYELAYKKGGGEGEGEDVERVFVFQEHNVFVLLTGFYSSHNGIDWDDEVKEVFPKRVTQTKYVLDKDDTDDDSDIEKSSYSYDNN